MEKWAGQIGAASWRLLTILAAVTVIAAVVVPALPSSANHAGAVSGVFESRDGDLARQHAADVAADWNDFETGATAAAWNFTPLTDSTGNPDDIFGGGVKQDQDCPSVKTGSLGGGNSKFDLSRIYLAHKNIAGADYLFLAWIRVPQSSQTASSHIAYEFNKGTDGTCAGSDQLKRVEGDKLIVYDFAGGSADPLLKMLTWKTAGSCEVSSNSAPCWGDAQDLNTAGTSDGKVNTASVGPVTDAIANPDQSLGIVEFGEAGINLTAAGVTDPCDFAGFVTGVSRSSGNSGTAAMKDQVGPDDFTLPGCVATTSIKTLVSLHDSATIVGFDSEGVGDHTGDVTFTLYGPEDQNCNGIVDGTTSDVAPLRYTETFDNVTSGTVGPTTTAYVVQPDDTFASPAVVNEGLYNWVVSYTGDDKNLASSSVCGTETVNVQYNF